MVRSTVNEDTPLMLDTVDRQKRACEYIQRERRHQHIPGQIASLWKKAAK